MIVPSFTFGLTVGSIVVNGAVPVFADVNEATQNISPESIEKSITDKIKIISVDGLLEYERKERIPTEIKNDGRSINYVKV